MGILINLGFIVTSNIDQIKIVLLQTFHPGNIGAAARAMKNMGLSQLVLVNPVSFPDEEATSRAGQAVDVLENAQVVSSLEEAVADCALVIGTSARDRTIKLPALNAEQAGQKMVAESAAGPVALVFGRERMGLHNEDLKQCHFQVNIDASPVYPVLNIAQAIQLMTYEIFKASGLSSHKEEFSNNTIYPTNEELNHFYGYWQELLEQHEFKQEQSDSNHMDHLRAMIRRARPSRKELGLLRSSLRALHSDKPE